MSTLCQIDIVSPFFFIKICLGEELKNQTINNYDIRNVQLMMSIINK